MKLKLYLITLLTILGSFSASAQSVDTLSNRAGIPQIVSRINKLILSIDSTIISYIDVRIPITSLSDSGKFLATDGINSVWRNVPNPDLTPLERGLNNLGDSRVAREWSSDGGVILGRFDRGSMTLTNGSDTVRGHGTSWLTNQDSTWSLGYTYSFSSPSRQDSIMVLWDIIDDSTAILADNYDNWDGPYRWTGPTETIPINVSGNMATGYGSVAFGENAIAIDNFGIAIGSLAKAGSSAVAIGNANQALGPYSLAIGGSDSKVTGWFNTSVGALNYITGSNSSAFGYQNVVPGHQSYAFGSYNSVQSHVSYVLGTYLISKNQGSVIIGTYNDTTSTAAFAVGTGQATFYPATRKNSFEVFSDGTTKQYKSPWGASYDSLYITTKGYVDTKLAQNPQYWGRSNTSIFPISPTGMDSTIFKIAYNGTARIKTGPWGTDSALVANKGYVDKIVTSLILDTNALHAQKFALINDSLLAVSLMATSTKNDLTAHIGTADAHLPSQTGQAGKVLGTDGTVSAWRTFDRTYITRNDTCIVIDSSTAGHYIVSLNPNCRGASYDSLYITTKGYVDTKLAQNPQYWGRSNTSIFPISPTGMDSTIFKIAYNGTARIKTGPWGTDSALVANKGYVDKIVTSLILDTNALHAQKFALINDSLLSVSLRATSTANVAYNVAQGKASADSVHTVLVALSNLIAGKGSADSIHTQLVALYNIVAGKPNADSVHTAIDAMLKKADTTALHAQRFAVINDSLLSVSLRATSTANVAYNVAQGKASADSVHTVLVALSNLIAGKANADSIHSQLILVYNMLAGKPGADSVHTAIDAMLKKADTTDLHAQKFAIINDSLLSISLRATTTKNDLTAHIGTADAHLPTQTGQSGKYLQSNGTVSSWQTAVASEVDPTALSKASSVADSSLSGGNRSISTTGRMFVSDDSITFVGEAGDIINAALGNVFRGTLGANDTLSVSNMTDGQILSIVITNAGTHTLSWTGVNWAGGTAPTLSATANKRDVFTLIRAGGIVYGSAVQDLR